VTPEELSARHPRLFHVTGAGAWESIRTRGLLSTSRLLDLFEVSGERRAQLERARRPAAVPLHHPVHGTAVLTDQLPMTEAALARCLDGGLVPADWLALLNRRVFFWSDEGGLDRLLKARANRGRALEVLVVDTLPLVRAYADRVELSPINTGATMRRPARRGPETFTPLGALSYDAWSRRRGKRDAVLEVTVLDGVPDVERYVLEVRRVRGASPPSPHAGTTAVASTSTSARSSSSPATTTTDIAG
jgi:hypothetical protein